MNKWLLPILAIIALVIVVLGILLHVLTPRAVTSVPTHIKVGDYVGINLDTDKLYFGTVAPSNSAQRSLIITSQKDSFVVITSRGSTGEWIAPEENHFSIAGKEEKRIRFNAHVPAEASFGNHTGYVEVRFYRPLARILLG